MLEEFGSPWTGQFPASESSESVVFPLFSVGGSFLASSTANLRVRQALRICFAARLFSDAAGTS